MARDPERWSHGNGAPPEMEQLLSAAKQDLPGAAELAGLEGSLAALLDAPPGAAPAPAPAAPSPLPAAAKLAVLVAVGALVGTAGYFAATHGSTPSAVTPPKLAPSSSDLVTSTQGPSARSDDERASKPTTAVEPAAPLDITNSAQPAEPKPKAAPSPVPHRGAVSKPSEASLLSQAQRALKSDPRRALAITEQHKRLYPSGTLTQEREVIAIEALARLNKKNTAQQKADEFSEKYPESAHQKKVDTLKK